jgi:hypothetical protein
MNNKKLVKQIARLCEKQFRKGYQQGYGACKDNLITEKQVDKFRFDGIIQDYKKVVNPVFKYKEDAIERLLAESMMSDMQELITLFHIYQYNKNKSKNKKLSKQ